MSEPSDKYVLESLADALEALAQKYWYDGHSSLAARLNAAVDVLRAEQEPR